MTRRTAALFGGALFAAGLAHHVRAQEFIFLPYMKGNSRTTDLFALGTDIRFIHGAFDFHYGDTPATALGSVNANYAGFGGSASVSNHRLHCEAFTAYAQGTGFGSSMLFAYFTVSELVDLRVYWDFFLERAPDPFMTSTLELVDMTDVPRTLLCVETSPAYISFGIEDYRLEPGRRYLFRANPQAFEPGGLGEATATLLSNCFADCNNDGAYNVDDVECFVVNFLDSNFDAGDCDGNLLFNVEDVECFVNTFLTQCQ